MFDRHAILPALVASLGVFLVTVAFLPHAGSFTYQGQVEWFFASREHWELPFLTGGGAFLFLVGVAALFRRPRTGLDTSPGRVL